MARVNRYPGSDFVSHRMSNIESDKFADITVRFVNDGSFSLTVENNCALMWAKLTRDELIQLSAMVHNALQER